jgi:phage antirepressor YoqD-like protein
LQASLIRDLHANEGYGLIFETETDTLYAANKSEFGNFSDILRKGFHSENLSVNRIGFEDGAVEIDKVILNVLLSSTLDQCFKLMPTYDNGLFSRNAFYILPYDAEFKQVFAKPKTQKIYALLKKIGENFKLIGLENLKRYDKEFTLTDKQQERFLVFFRFINDTSIKIGRNHLKGNINRLGLICTRIAMLLTYQRNFNLNFDPEKTSENQSFSIAGEITCNDIDFEIALSIAQILICHLLMVDDLYQYKNPKQSNSISIHSGKRYSNETKREAMRLREKGMSYAMIAGKVLKDRSKKGTIYKWESKKDSLPVSVSETETNCEKITLNVREALQKAKVSFFDNVTQANSSDVFDLFSLLTTPMFRDTVNQVRTADTERQKQIKLSLPAFTASGVFKGSRKKENLKSHSGFICIDIDKQDNLDIENFAKLKQELSNILNIAYIGHSVSGKGFFVLIPIENPEMHEQYFVAIQEAFNQLGIVIDKSCKDVSRLRIVSYDKSYYIPEKAMVLNTLIESNTDMKAFEFVDDERFTNTINAIEKQKIDITARYTAWFGIGCAIANTFNEKGRSYFHTVSKFYPKYNVKETDEQYSACLKNARENGYSLGTFFYLASLHDINV